MTEYNLVEVLTPHVSDIMADAEQGNVRAQEIITLYRMWQKCPGDPAAPELCRATFEDWLKKRGAKE